MIKTAKSKFGEIEFKYLSAKISGDYTKWTEGVVDAYLREQNNEKAGFIRLTYVSKEDMEKIYHDMVKNKGENRTKLFKQVWENKPVIDYVKVKWEWQKGGIGLGLYIAAAKWMAEKDMCLYASTSQSEYAKQIWKQLEKLNFPIKYDDDNRKCLDFR